MEPDSLCPAEHTLHVQCWVLILVGTLTDPNSSKGRCGSHTTRELDEGLGMFILSGNYFVECLGSEGTIMAFHHVQAQCGRRGLSCTLWLQGPHLGRMGEGIPGDQSWVSPSHPVEVRATWRQGAPHHCWGLGKTYFY